MSFLSAGLVSAARRLIASPFSAGNPLASSLSAGNQFAGNCASSGNLAAVAGTGSSLGAVFCRSVASLTSAFATRCSLGSSKSPAFLAPSLSAAFNLDLPRFVHPRRVRPDAKRRRQNFSFHERTQTAGGRAVLWRRIIARKPRLAS